MRSSLGSSLLAAWLTVAGGCDGPGAPTDARRDASPFPADLPVVTLDDGSEPDLACLGTHRAPDGGAPTPWDFLVDLPGVGSPYTLGGVLEVYPSPVVGESCGADCMLADLSPGGSARATLPSGGLFSFRLRPSAADGAMPVINERLEARLGSQAYAVYRDLLAFVASSFDVEARPESGWLATIVVDCAHRRMRGAVARVFLADGSELVSGDARDDFRVGYFDPAASPAPDARHTGDGGSVGIVNVDAPGGWVRIEAWGRRSPSAEPTRLGCETLTVVPGGFAFLGELGPLRADYPRGDPRGDPCRAP